MGNTFSEWFSDFLDFTFPKLEWYGYLVNSFLCIACILFAGLMSGLTLGLLSFDKMSLEILIASGTKSEKKKGKCIYSIVRHHHWLLVTLLIANAIAMEALPLFLDKMVPGAIAILLSVTGILLFGEIIPQAICSRYALSIGYYATLGVWLLMIVSCPISLPIAFILDCILGKHEITFYKRAGLSELVKKHAQEASQGHGPLTNREITTIRGALETSEKTVSHADVMTKWDNVYMLEKTTVLTRKTVSEIIEKGHSRIPIFEDGDKQKVVGLLLVKQLIRYFGIDWESDPVEIGYLELRKMPAVDKDFTLWDMLSIFKDGNTHMALVYAKKESGFYEDAASLNLVEYIGIVTLEEVIEELIQVEIYDEFDGIRKEQKELEEEEENLDLESQKNKESTLEKHAGVAAVLRKVRLEAIKRRGVKKTYLTTPRVENTQNSKPSKKEETEGEANEDEEVISVVDGYDSESINKIRDEIEENEKAPLLQLPNFEDQKD